SRIGSAGAEPAPAPAAVVTGRRLAGAASAPPGPSPRDLLSPSSTGRTGRPVCCHHSVSRVAWPGRRGVADASAARPTRSEAWETMDDVHGRPQPAGRRGRAAARGAADDQAVHAGDPASGTEVRGAGSRPGGGGREPRLGPRQ